MRVVVWFCLVYLAMPILLLLAGSFGRAWSNTMLPAGVTGQWYLEVAGDPSFRRAFITSIQVVGATCVLNLVLGLPLAYAIYKTSRREVRRAARIISLMPIAVPELVLAVTTAVAGAFFKPYNHLKYNPYGSIICKFA